MKNRSFTTDLFTGAMEVILFQIFRVSFMLSGQVKKRSKSSIQQQKI